jgi:hypothetical protein
VSVPVPIVWLLKTTFTVPVGAAVEPDTDTAYGVGWLKKQQSPLEYTGAPLTPEEPVLPTTICTVAVIVVKSVVSVGVKSTLKVCVPAASTVPDGGVYWNDPGRETPPNDAVASSCVPLNAVPTVIAAGVGQVITGVAWVTVMVVLPVAPV